MIDRQQLADYKVFEAKPPRYTSYPTAAHFTRGVGSEDRRAWLSALDPDDPVSVYVHIPFCRRLCWFCACRTQGVKSDGPVTAYLDVLGKEIATLAETVSARPKAAALHFGGGTPTILSAEQIGRLKQMLESAFDMEDVKFSVEIDPNDVDEARIAALAAAGMSRASIGIQDFDPEIQKAIGRLQSYELTADVVAKLRAAGIDSLNADLVYGLPGQTAAGLTRTVKRLLWLKPDRIALFGYAHVPWMSRRQVMIKEEHLPGPEARFGLFETARKLFLDAGYVAIGIDHFAKPDDPLAIAAAEGTMRRNFQGYTEDPAETLIGLGASAVSRFPQGYVQNQGRTVDYVKDIEATGFAGARGHRFHEDDLWRATAIERFMCDFRLDLDDPRLGKAAGSDEIMAIGARILDTYPGHVTAEGHVLSLDPEAHALARLVAQHFDDYDPAGRGSNAI